MKTGPEQQSANEYSLKSNVAELLKQNMDFQMQIGVLTAQIHCLQLKNTELTQRVHSLEKEKVSMITSNSYLDKKCRDLLTLVDYFNALYLSDAPIETTNTTMLPIQIEKVIKNSHDGGQDEELDSQNDVHCKSEGAISAVKGDDFRELNIPRAPTNSPNLSSPKAKQRINEDEVDELTCLSEGRILSVTMPSLSPPLSPKKSKQSIWPKFRKSATDPGLMATKSNQEPAKAANKKSKKRL